MVKRQPKGSKSGGQFAPDRSGSVKIPKPVSALAHVSLHGSSRSETNTVASFEQLHERLTARKARLTPREYQQTGKYRAEKLRMDITPEGFSRLESTISEVEGFIGNNPNLAYSQDLKNEILPVLLQRKADALNAIPVLETSRQ